MMMCSAFQSIQTLIYAQLMAQEMTAQPKWQSAHAVMDQHLRHDDIWSVAEHAVPEEWHLLTGSSTTLLKSLRLRMPNCKYYSAITINMLASEVSCPSCRKSSNLFTRSVQSQLQEICYS